VAGERGRVGAARAAETAGAEPQQLFTLTEVPRPAPNWRDRVARTAPVSGPLAIFGAATLCHVLALWPISRIQNTTVTGLLMKWDAGWYLKLAQQGYPTHLPPRAHMSSTAGFYPLYPLLVRGLIHGSAIHGAGASITVAIVTSALALVVVWQLAARLCDEGVAYRAVALTAFAPGAFVLSMGYSEGLLLLFASATLLMLLDRRWLLAGICAGLACLARPTGVAAAVACAVAAFVALREYRRDLRPLLAPVLAGIGAVTLPIYHLIHTGDALAYWKTQKYGWHESFDFGLSTLRSFAKWTTHPLRDVNILFASLAFIVLVAGIVLLVRWRPPAPVTAYALTIAVLTIGASSYASTFRFVLIGVPFTIAFARALRHMTFAIGLACSAALFTMLAITATTLYYTP